MTVVWSFFILGAVKLCTYSLLIFYFGLLNGYRIVYLSDDEAAVHLSIANERRGYRSYVSADKAAAN